MSKMKKYKNKLKSTSNLEVAFNCQLNIDDPNPLYPKYSNRAYLRGHISDDCMRNILWPVLENEGLIGCSNEELCEFLVQNDIWDETQASIFTLNYIANKEEYNNVERD